ncbi:MAG: hypothetical protein R6U21_07780, partial [Thermoplasmatota archaeon]
MYSVTTWFGIFLYQNDELVDSVLFPHDVKQLSEIFICLYNNEVLPEEIKVIGKDTVVGEYRLSSIGKYRPRDHFFEQIDISCEDFGFSLDLLQKALVQTSNQLVFEDLERKDYQIVQMINSIDELVQISNLLKERLDCWLIFPTDENDVQPVTDLIGQVDEKMHQLEESITVEITQLAPNTTELIGPLLSARLLAVAGTMHRLACFPASSIQLLGAEKAFFRFKKEGGNPPKHGVIFQHPLINKSPRKLR